MLSGPLCQSRRRGRHSHTSPRTPPSFAGSGGPFNVSGSGDTFLGMSVSYSASQWNRSHPQCGQGPRGST